MGDRVAKVGEKKFGRGPTGLIASAQMHGQIRLTRRGFLQKIMGRSGVDMHRHHLLRAKNPHAAGFCNWLIILIRLSRLSPRSSAKAFEITRTCKIPQSVHQVMYVRPM